MGLGDMASFIYVGALIHSYVGNVWKYTTNLTHNVLLKQY